MPLLKIIISDTVLLALITSVTALLTLWLNHRFGKLKAHVNSRMDELLKIVRSEALAEGQLKGRADEKTETAVAAATVAAATPPTANHSYGFPAETKIEGKIEGTIKPKKEGE